MRKYNCWLFFQFSDHQTPQQVSCCALPSPELICSMTIQRRRCARGQGPRPSGVWDRAWEHFLICTTGQKVPNFPFLQSVFCQSFTMGRRGSRDMRIRPFSPFARDQTELLEFRVIIRYPLFRYSERPGITTVPTCLHCHKTLWKDRTHQKWVNPLTPAKSLLSLLCRKVMSHQPILLSQSSNIILIPIQPIYPNTRITPSTPISTINVTPRSTPESLPSKCPFCCRGRCVQYFVRPRAWDFQRAALKSILLAAF